MIIRVFACTPVSFTLMQFGFIILPVPDTICIRTYRCKSVFIPLKSSVNLSLLDKKIGVKKIRSSRWIRIICVIKDSSLNYLIRRPLRDIDTWVFWVVIVLYFTTTLCEKSRRNNNQFFF